MPAAVIAATAAVSALNYAFALILLWSLPSHDYAVVASITALLLVFGTVAGASAPWVLAREVAVSARDPERRQRAMAFAGVVALVQSFMAALICGIIVHSYAPWKTTITACSATIAIFTASAAVGYLQGTERFNLISCLRVGEVVLKIAIGVILIHLGSQAWGAVSGFTFGALLVFVGSVHYMRRDLLVMWHAKRESWLRTAVADRRLWLSARGIVGIQAGTAVIAGMDLVVASILISGSRGLANYQAVQILGRIPFYVASSLAIIVFPRMARLRVHEGLTVASSLRVWIRVCGVATVIVATIPAPILSHVLPARYASAAVLLPWAALTGFALGGINLMTTYWQAVGRCKAAVSILAIICLVSAVCDVVSLLGGNTLHLAWSATATTMAGLCLLIALVRRDWTASLRGLGRHVLIVAVPGVALLLLRAHLLAWTAAAFCIALPAMRSLWQYGASLTTSQRPGVLHLAFEDPRRPGAGGGSVRTFEVDRRLTGSFDVTVVCARYPGSRPRRQHGVRYVHVGLPWGQKLSLLSYFFCLPWALLRYPSDLVIEDFAAPFSSVAIPWMTSRPVIGVVQWLFAQEKTLEYKLPFHLVERVGLASHRHLVAVSEDLARELRIRNRRAQVQVIQNGLPDEAFVVRRRPRNNILYLGRLEIAQKGIDILVRSFAQVAPYTDRTLAIAGSGPDEGRVRALVNSLGVGDRISFLGHVAASKRFDLLASAELVAMPSRYETFGMVAAEALAVGTPVVAFNIPCLRSILSSANGVLVSPFDTEAFGTALVRVLKDEHLKYKLANMDKTAVDHLRWDGLAAAQETFYERVLIGAK